MNCGPYPRVGPRHLSARLVLGLAQATRIRAAPCRLTVEPLMVSIVGSLLLCLGCSFYYTIPVSMRYGVAELF